MQQENERQAGIQNAAVGVARVNVHVEQMRERWEKMASELKVRHFLELLSALLSTFPESCYYELIDHCGCFFYGRRRWTEWLFNARRKMRPWTSSLCTCHPTHLSVT